MSLFYVGIKCDDGQILRNFLTLVLFKNYTESKVTPEAAKLCILGVPKGVFRTKFFRSNVPPHRRNF